MSVARIATVNPKVKVEFCAYKSGRLRRANSCARFTPLTHFRVRTVSRPRFDAVVSFTLVRIVRRLARRATNFRCGARVWDGLKIKFVIRFFRFSWVKGRGGGGQWVVAYGVVYGYSEISLLSLSGYYKDIDLFKCQYKLWLNIATSSRVSIRWDGLVRSWRFCRQVPYRNINTNYRPIECLARVEDISLIV